MMKRWLGGDVKEKQVKALDFESLRDDVCCIHWFYGYEGWSVQIQSSRLMPGEERCFYGYEGWSVHIQSRMAKGKA